MIRRWKRKWKNIFLAQHHRSETHTKKRMAKEFESLKMCSISKINAFSSENTINFTDRSYLVGRSDSCASEWELYFLARYNKFLLLAVCFEHVLLCRLCGMQFQLHAPKEFPFPCYWNFLIARTFLSISAELAIETYYPAVFSSISIEIIFNYIDEKRGSESTRARLS